MPNKLYRARQEHRVLVARLKDQFGDDEDLLDTIEGESPLPDAIAVVLRTAQEADAMAEGLGAYIDKLLDRKDLFKIRAQKLRTAALNAALEGDIKSISAPDFTASVVVGKPKVMIIGDVPDTFCKITKTPDKRALGDAMSAGLKPTYATWSNPEPYLVVRVK